MNIKIYLDIHIKNKTQLPIIKFQEKIFDYTNNSYIECNLNYPIENIIEFNVKNIEGGSANIKIVKIELNGIETNRYHNTSFEMQENRCIEEKIITSVDNISFNGCFKLYIDNLYVRSAQSNHWHCSNSKEDFIFYYEFTRDSFVDTYRDRNHIGFNKEFIPCFGCSFTYGAGQPDTETWPYLLSQKTNKNFLNLGMSGSGIDGIYNNLKLLYQKHKFDQCVILFPNFERRIVRSQIQDLWIRMHSTVDIFETDNVYQFYTDKNLRKKMKIIKEKIIKDVENYYSKKFLLKIINFCKNNNIELYGSSWDDDVYDYLKTHNNLKLLPKFPELSTFEERADDGGHPHKKYYDFFADQIKNYFS
jgi:hypothetical protein